MKVSREGAKEAKAEKGSASRARARVEKLQQKLDRATAAPEPVPEMDPSLPTTVRISTQAG